MDKLTRTDYLTINKYTSILFTIEEMDLFKILNGFIQNTFTLLIIRAQVRRQEYNMDKKYSLIEFIDIIHKLRSDNGCPWDKEQTHESLKRCIIEEAYEAVEGIDIYNSTGSYDNMREELGDVLLQVVMHSCIAEEEGIFCFDDVVDEIAAKMVRRHPHVFAEQVVGDANSVIALWEDIKAKEKEDKESKEDKEDKKSKNERAFIQIPNVFPALMKAEKLRKKQIKINSCSDEEICDIINNLSKNVKCIEKTVQDNDFNKIDAKKKIGELLYSVVKIAVQMGINSEESLDSLVKEYLTSI